MKQIKTKGIKKSRRYGELILGLCLCMIVTVSLIYENRKEQEEELTREEFLLGEDNPVSGPVAEAEAVKVEDEKEKEEKTKEDEMAAAAVKIRKISQGYDGKESLVWPVEGNILIPYSMDTTIYFETLDQYQCNPAIYLKAEEGTKVKTAMKGMVEEVTECNRYGKQVVIDMGNEYKMIYGQLKDVSVKAGDAVETGAVIGTIGEPTDYFTLEGSHLYLKMTYQGQAVNPADYLEG